MSIQTYAVLDNLPAPVTTGTTIQTFQDVLGDWWVAKNGVNGGNWFRARDVLYARWGRTAAYTYPTSGVNVPFNNVSRDVYGLWSSTSNAFVTPVAGLWRMNSQLCVAFTAVGQFIAMFIATSSYSVRTNFNAPVSGNQYCQAHDVFMCPAGDNLATTAYTSVALAMAGLTNSDCYLSVSYLGTG
jgi:hypothetical protein